MINSWDCKINSLKRYGRWEFAEFTDVYGMQADFAAKAAAEFDKMVSRVMVKETIKAS